MRTAHRLEPRGMLCGMLLCALSLSACSITVAIPEPDLAKLTPPASAPIGPGSVFFAPDVRGFILNDPGPPPIQTRTYRAPLGLALLAPLEEACAPIFTQLSRVSTRALASGDQWLLSFDNLVVRANSGENDPCQVQVFLQWSISNGEGTSLIEGLLDARGSGTEHQGALRYSESLGKALSQSVENLCFQLRKTLVARRGTFDDQRPKLEQASSG